MVFQGSVRLRGVVLRAAKAEETLKSARELTPGQADRPHL